VDLATDSVTDQISDDPDPLPFDRRHHGRSEVTDVVAHDRRIDRCVERSTGRIEEPLRLRVDRSDREGIGRVGAPAVQPHPDVDGHDVPLGEEDARLGDSVDDLLVHRDARSAGESVESLERRHRSRVAANEGLDLFVEALRRDPGLHEIGEVLEETVDDRAALRDGVDLARGA